MAPILVAAEERLNANYFAITCVSLKTIAFNPFRETVIRISKSLISPWHISKNVWRLILPSLIFHASDRQVSHLKVTLLECTTEQYYNICNLGTLGLHRSASMDETSLATGAETHRRTSGPTFFKYEVNVASVRWRGFCSSVQCVFCTVFLMLRPLYVDP